MENRSVPFLPRLADDTAPLTSADLLTRLETLGITHRTVEHSPVYTVAESRGLRADFPGGHSKNLFLRNKKGRMWLVTCLEDREIDPLNFHPLDNAMTTAISADGLLRFLEYTDHPPQIVELG